MVMRYFCWSIAATAVMLCSSTPATAQALPPRGPALPTQEERARAAAVVTASFVDPSSVQINNLTFTRLGAAAVFCGQINAKNRMGGYTGFQPFVIFAGEINVYDGRPGTRRAFERLEAMTCNGGVRTPIASQ